ncbi:Putative translation initiation inhibitor, yjgF family [Prochlorococcus marinus str. MIT 9515]|uniref:Putative translation initiation inhibitor, yjgF family n=1 Tax=Prochlorococcus marinus (strain MIT 9515) TaxID=167542 RepID=A2BVM0_PROM5|nr:Rid family detoxifying hydrolase [Prochlorococcus marinus]ABM71831.1 Putative translation initiation inhibitor, yjgF family [Prochlorococcus marinus str. MIT 9515]
MSSSKVIKTSNAPDPVGPYNQAIKAGNFIYCSGQIAIDPVSNEINCLGNIEKETTQVLKNLLAVLNSGGATAEDVIKTTIYLTDLKNFKTVNEIYSDFFKVKNPPARACVEVSSLPKGVLIEIDCVAYLD